MRGKFQGRVGAIYSRLERWVGESIGILFNVPCAWGEDKRDNQGIVLKKPSD